MFKDWNKQLANWHSQFILVNFVIALLISLRYLAPQPLPDNLAAGIFLSCYFIAHLGLLTLMLLAVIRLISRFIRQAAITRIFSIALVGLSLALLLTDTFVYQQYRFHLNAMILKLILEGGNEILSFSWQLWLRISLMIIAFFLAQGIISECLWRKFFHMRIRLKAIVLSWCLLFLFAQGLNIWADATFRKDITRQAFYLPLSYPLTAKSLIAKLGLLDLAAYKQQALLAPRQSKSSLHYPLSAMTCNNKRPLKNIILLVVDSWRSDMMNPEVTPAITQLATQGSIFTRHYSGSNNTRHGLFSLFYGLPGHYWQPVLNQQRSPVLIDILKQQTYQIGVFSSAKLTSPEFDQTIFSAVNPLRSHSEGRTPAERDLDITRDFGNWYQSKNQEQPYFAFLFYDAPHGLSVPKDSAKIFQPSLDYANYMALDKGYDPRSLFNLYKNAIYYMDQQVAQVLKLIENDLDNTIIIITGDHGKEFNDNGKGYWGHNSNYSDYQTRVPLVIYWPGNKHDFFSGETSHYDIAPTLLSGALGCKNATADYSIGQSLFDKNSHGHIILGRDGNYAIKIGEQLNEIDRFGNFAIYNNQYQELPEAKLNISQALVALEELRRFYQK
ncbi:DUF3413 domain-containing protein [Thalassomonas sp. RHCl1]|uniref:DUF3413 domain-containing protein n=1 Tax=Thalassomonas sp. RHCl1 TaxID=2995320 RepID=UPI00248B2BC0|nr:DUF3413 domain-containing protein [Thalassomonas sp. RHCl1]